MYFFCLLSHVSPSFFLFPLACYLFLSILCYFWFFSYSFFLFHFFPSVGLSVFLSSFLLVHPRFFRLPPSKGWRQRSFVDGNASSMWRRLATKSIIKRTKITNRVSLSLSRTKAKPKSKRLRKEQNAKKVHVEKITAFFSFFSSTDSLTCPNS